MNTSSKMLRAMVVPKAMPRHTLMLRFTRAYCWAPKFCPTKVVMAMPKALITIQMKPSILPMAAQEAMASVPKELMLACTTRLDTEYSTDCIPAGRPMRITFFNMLLSKRMRLSSTR
ncbi:unknown [Firmicutes bacterium CAG:94]|nr:unknown [Firmicutes bacterium CAG:94]